MEPAIHVRGLSKSFGDLAAVRDVNLTVQPGEVFGLLGANGAGKTTTIECILGTTQPDTGTVTILGMDPRAERKSLFRRVGVQFQEARYPDNITVAELCQETACLYPFPADYSALLQRFGLADTARQPVAEISGGQRQRLFVVLALLPNPEVVFLDELTTGLDIRARREVWDCLTELKSQGLTVFLSSHYMDEVETLCDRIMILRQGQTVFAGTVSEAISSSGLDRLDDAYLAYADGKVAPYASV
ncbi:MAG: ABC transporter ATP-binding protein [Propionibacteriaceae bacterium]|jgi:ABC-2 type transport system ATP-binding protein|nr:ABC transporter ATP-binding protein [Propionibacteriaceae bacterium]